MILCLKWDIKRLLNHGKCLAFQDFEILDCFPVDKNTNRDWITLIKILLLSWLLALNLKKAKRTTLMHLQSLALLRSRCRQSKYELVLWAWREWYIKCHKIALFFAKYSKLYSWNVITQQWFHWELSYKFWVQLLKTINVNLIKSEVFRTIFSNIKTFHFIFKIF